MKKLLLANLILIFHVSAAGAAPILSDEESYKVMQETLFDIRDALKEIRQEHTQLTDIDSATIKMEGLEAAGRIRLDYEKGVVKENKSGAVFWEDGCDIVVQIKYPAEEKDVAMRPQIKGNLLPLKNGNSYAVWQQVRTAPNEEGDHFQSKANKIISYHLKLMQAKLKGIIK